MTIFTSGSTGLPKGVVVENRSLALYLAWALDKYPGLSVGSLVHSPVTFDLTVTGLFGPLLAGGTVEFIFLDTSIAKSALNGAAFVKATPGFVPFLGALPQRFSPTQDLVLGGEALYWESLNEWRADNPGVVVINEYGPTETTVGCMEFRILPGDKLNSTGPVPIGTPAWNTCIYVLDDDLAPVAVEEKGEIYISGGLVTRGYLGQPGITATRYVADPFGPSGSVMYRTGDRASWDQGGNLRYLGRTDDQVKVQGYRVEPGEVEEALMSAGGVLQAAVALRSGWAGQNELHAFVVVAGTADADGIGAHVARLLPTYMRPSRITIVRVLPTTSNGKVDRNALLALAG